MKTRFRFEKLEVWPEARKINRVIDRPTRKLPRAAMFAMTSQIRRASISVSSNIAEGSGRNSDRDSAHYLAPAYGSLRGIASLSYLALDDGYVDEAGLDPLFDELERLAKRTTALNRSLEVPASKPPFSPRPRRT